MGVYKRLFSQGQNLIAGLMSSRAVKKAGSRSVASAVSAVGGNKRTLKTGVELAQLSGGQSISKNVAKRVAKSTNVDPLVNRRVVRNVVAGGLIGGGALGLTFAGGKVYDDLRNIGAKTDLQRQIDQRNVSDSNFLDNLSRQNDLMFSGESAPFNTNDAMFNPLSNPSEVVSQELEEDQGLTSGGVSPLAVGGLLALGVGAFFLFKKKKNKKK